jgi:hypothetical protein
MIINIKVAQLSKWIKGSNKLPSLQIPSADVQQHQTTQKIQHK